MANPEKTKSPQPSPVPTPKPSTSSLQPPKTMSAFSSSDLKWGGCVTTSTPYPTPTPTPTLTPRPTGGWGADATYGWGTQK